MTLITEAHLNQNPKGYFVDFGENLQPKQAQELTGIVRRIDERKGISDEARMWTHDADEAGGEIKEFTDTKTFKQLTPREQALSMYAIRYCSSEPWRYGFRELDDEGTLFPYSGPYPVVSQPASLLDAMVLSGAIGWKIVEGANGGYERMKIGEFVNKLSPDRFRQLQLLGALAFQKDPLDKNLERVAIDRKDEASAGYFMVGNNINSDFVVEQMLYAGGMSKPVITPLGEETTLIKPVISREFITASYHDFVPIVRGLLLHLKQSLSPENTKTIKQAILATIPHIAGENRNRFGNFGDVSKLEIGETQAKIGRGTPFKDGDIIETGTADATGLSHDYFYALVHRANQVDLQQITQLRPGKVRLDKSITITDEEIPAFVKAMLTHQGSRASNEYLAWTIETVLSPKK